MSGIYRLILSDKQ